MAVKQQASEVEHGEHNKGIGFVVAELVQVKLRRGVCPEPPYTVTQKTFPMLDRKSVV